MMNVVEIGGGGDRKARWIVVCLFLAVPVVVGDPQVQHGLLSACCHRQHCQSSSRHIPPPEEHDNRSRSEQELC